jgi:dGTP triphosphohydrolase
MGGPTASGVYPANERVTSQREHLRQSDTHEERVRVAADLISSMTEDQLMLTHHKLFGIELGSITDLI